MNNFNFKFSFFFMASFFLCSQINAQTIWKVGPDKTYKTPSSVANLVNDGDLVEIDAAIYPNDFATWIKNNLIIKGVNGRPHLKASTSPPNGKAIWVITGKQIQVENIEFSGCKVPDKNGAGIRVEGADAVIEKCYFHENEMGILQGIVKKYNLTIQHSEFYKNGLGGSGQTHNVYIGNIDTLFFRFNYSHDSYVGHELKSRAANNWIEYNVISNETTNDARTIDLSEGGYSVVIGNVITQSPYSENYHILGYGMEGLNASVTNNLYVVNNTFVNFRGNGTFIQTRSGTNKAYVYNNIFSGNYSEGMIVTYNGTATPLDSLNNVYFPDISSTKFNDASMLDLSLQNNSPAIGIACVPVSTTTGYSLVPQYEFYKSFEIKKLNLAGRNRYDAGAYQTDKGNSTGIINPANLSGILVALEKRSLRISNTTGEPICSIHIFDLSGNCVYNNVDIHSSICNYTFSRPSVYIVKVNTEKSEKTIKVLVQ